ncbi:MAG: response regulator [Acidobacteriota bacterium]
MSERVLIIEDEAPIAEILVYNLEQAGFAVTVESRGDRALAACLTASPDLILLDVMLPGLDGFELTRLLKRDPSTASIPLLMVTARDEETDRIVGLELGADDYITKPFSPREVVLRVKAVLRRVRPAEPASAVLRAGAIALDAAAHRVQVGERDVSLTATEFRLLALLLERRGRVQTRAQLLRDVWGFADDVDSRTVDTHIRRLRGKLRPADGQIETLVGVGYRLS